MAGLKCIKKLVEDKVAWEKVKEEAWVREEDEVMKEVREEEEKSPRGASKGSGCDFEQDEILERGSSGLHVMDLC